MSHDKIKFKVPSLKFHLHFAISQVWQDHQSAPREAVAAALGHES